VTRAQALQDKRDAAEEGRGLGHSSSHFLIQRQPISNPNPRVPQLQVPYYINFRHVAPPASPDHSLGNPGPSGGADRAGYTKVTLKRRMTIAWDNLPPLIENGVRMVPLYIRSANIFFRLEPIEVYISSRYAVDSCPYRVIMQHEYQHVSAFVRIFRKCWATMKREANAIRLPTADSPKNTPEANIGIEQRRITRPLIQSINKVRNIMLEEMRKDRDARDASSAYAKEYAKCPSDEW